MNNRLKILAGVIGLIGAGVSLAYLAGASRWRKDTARIVEELNQTALPGKIKTVSFKDLEDLPPPVKRYFKFSLRDDFSIVRIARIRHTGEFSLNNKWIPFESDEYFSAVPPAFVWDAKMKMNALVDVRVRDRFQKGRGSMLAKIFSLFTVVNASGNEELAAGALQRYLAEAAWVPTALLPSENLQWSPIDEIHARATLSDSGITVSLEFEFGAAGEIVGTYSPARFKETGGEYKPFPWSGRFWNYKEHNGMMIPTEGEVEWLLPEGRQPYWRGRVVETEYRF